MTNEEALEVFSAVKERIEHFKACGCCFPLWTITERDEEAIDMAIEALTNVQNMHKGKWIKKQVFNPELDEYIPLIECSVCGYEPYFCGSESKFNYCANCGARMEK